MQNKLTLLLVVIFICSNNGVQGSLFNDIYKGMYDKVDKVVDQSGGNLNDTLADFKKGVGKLADVPNMVTNLGGNLVDLIKETTTRIPEILTSGLWVYDDNNNAKRITLEIPPLFELSGDMREKVFFTLYTRENPNGEPVAINDANFKKSHFNPKRPTVFTTHGWIQSSKSQAVMNVKDAYLENGDYNIIAIDWSKISKNFYLYAANMVTAVGKYVAQMVDFLVAQGANPDDIRLVGHSLGAHVAGLGGYYANSKVGYVVGMDPALPLFFSSTPKARISTDSANSVEIIHSNAGLLGFLDPIGHADFYPNGGSVQPGCAFVNTACHHIRSVYYYAESINNPEAFIGNQCKSQDQLFKKSCIGHNGVLGTQRYSLPTKGAFYLVTGEAKPFGLGLKGKLA